MVQVLCGGPWMLPSHASSGLVSGVGFRPPKIQMLESSSPVPEDMIGIGENVFTEVKLGPSGRALIPYDW